MRAPPRARFSLLAMLALSQLAHAEAEGVTPTLHVRTETGSRLFQRALLPGPGGSLVSTETGAPVYEFVQLRAVAPGTAVHAERLELELASWGLWQLTDLSNTRTFDGDVQTAFVTLGWRSGLARLGRQQMAGGAARFVRFDGARATLLLPSGLSVTAYGGWSVLPRWDELVGYHHLGDARDALLRAPERLVEPRRSEHWLAGAQVNLEHDALRSSLSVHEEHETGGVAQRNLGADANVEATPELSFSGSALASLDALKLSELRLWLDAEPLESVDIYPEYAFAQPTLLLSRQSVLSAFSSDGYHELGATARWAALDALTFELGGFEQWFETTGRGGRFETSLRVTPDELPGLALLLRYSRVLSRDNGYHAFRQAISTPITPALSATLDSYAYFYDEPILGISVSSVQAATLGYELSSGWGLLVGASLARSPYARFDAQGLARLNYASDWWQRRAAW